MVDLAELAAVTQRNLWVGDPNLRQYGDVDDDLCITTAYALRRSSRSLEPSSPVIRTALTPLLKNSSATAVAAQPLNKRQPSAVLRPLPVLDHFLVNHFVFRISSTASMSNSPPRFSTAERFFVTPTSMTKVRGPTRLPVATSSPTEIWSATLVKTRRSPRPSLRVGSRHTEYPA